MNAGKRWSVAAERKAGTDGFRPPVSICGSAPLPEFKVSRGYQDSASGNHRMTSTRQRLEFRTSLRKGGEFRNSFGFVSLTSFLSVFETEPPHFQTETI